MIPRQTLLWLIFLALVAAAMGIYAWQLSESNTPGSAFVADNRPVAMLDDETLRDGLQSPSVRNPSIDEKIAILHRMNSLGIDTAGLDFRHVSETANGPVSGAPVTLREVAVGNVRLADVAASVNGAEMSESLLGMTFLSRLSGFEVSGDRLTLRQ